MWWTTEQVAEYTGMTVEQVYVTRRRKEWPGVLGVRQGRAMRFDPELVQAGPVEPQRTDDPAVAAVWLLEDMRHLTRQIKTAVDEVRAWTRDQQAAPKWLTVGFSPLVDSDGEPWTVDPESDFTPICACGCRLGLHLFKEPKPCSIHAGCEAYRVDADEWAAFLRGGNDERVDDE